jgi:hypothetical protein
MEDEEILEGEQPEEIEVEVEESPESDRPAFDEAAILAQEEEDAKDIDKFPRPIKKRIETLTYHVRERERQIAEEKATSEALMQYGNGARTLIERQAKEIAELQKSLQREAIAAREAQLASTENEFRSARESADTDKEVAATRRMAELTQQRAQLHSYQVPEAFQPPPPPQRQESAPQLDPVTANWVQNNDWFGKDKMMRNYAVTFSEQLATQVEPQTEEFYSRIDAEMRQRFPERFETGAMSNNNAKPQQSASTSRRPPVATATRTPGAVNGTRKVVLSASQAAAARKIGVPLDEYAKFAHMVKE